MRFAALSLLWSWTIGLCAAQAADIIAYCEPIAPYSYEENGQSKGMSVDILKEVCAKAALSCEIRFVPWARAYRETLNTPNSLLFTTVRTPDREKLFSWIGPFAYRESWLFALGDTSFQVATIADLNRYKIGVVSSEASFQELKNLGIEEAALDISSSNEILIRKLLHGRVDMAASTVDAIAAHLAHQDTPVSKVRKVYRISRSGYYFALNLDTSPDLSRRLSQAFAEVAATGFIEAAIQRYHLSDLHY